MANLKRINNTKKLKAHQKAVLKRATQLYSVPLEKAADDSPKKSAEEIEEIVKKQFDGVGPFAAMKVDLAARGVIQKRGDEINQLEFGKLAIGELDILLR